MMRRNEPPLGARCYSHSVERRHSQVWEKDGRFYDDTGNVLTPEELLAHPALGHPLLAGRKADLESLVEKRAEVAAKVPKKAAKKERKNA